MSRRLAAWSTAAVLALCLPALTAPAAASCPGRDGCQEWASRYDGPARGDDRASAVVTDGARSYVAGSSYGGTTRQDVLVLAYGPDGSLVWSAGYDGPGTGFDRNDDALAIALSGDGSRIYVTGTGQPAGSPFSDVLTLALEAETGKILWASRYAGPAGRHDAGRDIAVAPDGGTVFVTGNHTVLTPTGGLEVDAFTMALDAGTGDRLWLDAYAGPVAGQDLMRRIAVAPDGGTVYAAGETRVAGTGSFSYDYLTIALDARSGARRWIATYNGSADDYDGAFGLALAPDGGRVFVTGQSRGVSGSVGGTDAATVAYDASTGARAWAARYDGPAGGFDKGVDAAVARDGSAVLVAGVQAVQGTGFDFLTVAYEPGTGEARWSAAFTGPEDGGTDSGFALGVGTGEVYVTGTSQNLEVDLDTATVAYDVRTGDERWSAVYATPPVGPYRDSPADLAVSPDGSQVVVAAQGPVQGQGFDTATIAYTAGRDGRPILSSLSGRRTGDVVEVEGLATFVEGPVTGAPDDPVDAGAHLRDTGAELTSASVRYDPASASLLLRLGVRGLREETGGDPAIVYGVDLAAGAATYQVRGGLRAGLSAAFPSFSLFRCQGACQEVGSLAGSIDPREGAVRVAVPIQALGASEGTALAGMRAFAALGEVTSGPIAVLDEVPMPGAAIPGRSVMVGIAPEGTPEDEVPLNVSASLLPDGGFAAALPAPAAAGPHAVWARACLGERCSTAASPLE